MAFAIDTNWLEVLRATNTLSTPIESRDLIRWYRYCVCLVARCDAESLPIFESEKLIREFRGVVSESEILFQCVRVESSGYTLTEFLCLMHWPEGT